MLTNRLGELLARENFVSEKQLSELLEQQRTTGGRLVDLIVAAGIKDEATLLQFISKHFKIPVMDLTDVSPDTEVTNLLPGAFCVKHGILPIGRRGDTLVAAFSDPTNIQTLDDIRFQTRMRVEPVLALPSAIKAQLERVYSFDVTKLATDMGNAESVGEEENPESMEGSASEMREDDAPIIQFVSQILVDAVRRRASDIHVEPYEKELRVRLRIDGDLVESIKPPQNVKNALIARIKVMSKMRLDEKRMPQDGRVRFKLPDGKTVDFRVNTLPTVYGEKVVLRILDQSGAVVDVSKLGFEKDDLEKFQKAITKPWGMVLVTGATGSGKTTTLYAALNKLNTPDVNISTIEDPVEYNFKGINQVQTKDQIGLTFAEALRALLRQDPDIILLGEIRDAETAEVAFKAALTGHMVLSTLHTNDAPSTIMRLKDMGVDLFLVNSAIHAIVAQRLIRKVCNDCRENDMTYSAEALKKLGFPDALIGKFQPVKGKGCTKCRNTGYRGRMAIHEVLVMSDRLRDLIGSGATTDVIRKQAIAEGMRTLKANLMRKVIAGVASLEELVQLGE